jgi:signal transduction histidine kinase
MALSKLFLRVVFLILVTSCAGYAQFHHKYAVAHYTDENGLPQNSIRAITGDQYGFIWLTTENGLVRFDGQKFFTFDKSNLNVSTTRFGWLFPDINGGDHQVFANNDSKEFVSIQGPHAIRTMAKSVDELNGGNLGNPSSFPFLLQNILPRDKPESSFNYLNTDSSNGFIIFIPLQPGSYYLIKGSRISFFRRWKKVKEFLHTGPVLYDLFALNGHLYNLDKNGNVSEIAPAGKDYVKLTGEILADPNYMPGKKNFTAYWNNVSDQFFILLNKNFYYLTAQPDGTLSTKLVLEDFDLIENNIENIHYDDKRSRLFLGSYTEGLRVFTRKGFRALTTSEKVEDNIFYGQVLAGENRVMTPNGNLMGLSGTSANVNDLKLEVSPLQEMARQKLVNQSYIIKDKEGNVWINYGWMDKFSPDGKRLLGRWNLEKSVIYYNTTMWIGYDQKGLGQVDLSGKNPVIRIVNQHVKQITYFLQSYQDELWVGTKKGLFLMNIKTSQASVIPGTQVLFIRSIYKSPSTDGIFFTTYENGFYYLHNGRLVNFPLDRNRYLSASHCITESGDGYFWITTNKGLFQFSKKDLLDYASVPAKDRVSNQKLFYIHYEKNSGFNTNEFNGGCQPCSVTLPDGKISLPSLNGLVWFNPVTIVPDLPGGKLFIDRLEVQGKSKMIRSDTVQLPLDPKQLGFHLTTPYFGNSNNLHLSYFISGSGEVPSGDKWLDISNADPVVRFSDLPYGTYTLLVRKMNGFGLNNYEVKRLVLIVPPHWYETWAFRLSCVALLGALIYLFVLLRTRTLNRRNEELEVSIRSRTQNLENTMIALKNSEANLSRQMKIQTHFMASISHDIRTPMKYLVAGAAKVENLINDSQYPEANITVRNIGASALMMNTLLENIIAYIKTNHFESDIGFHEIRLRQVLNEKIELFRPAMLEQSNRFVNEVHDNISVFSNDQLLGIILHNLMDNANKYTYKGDILLYAVQQGDELHLIIHDTGPGYPESVLRWLENSTVTPAEGGKPVKLSPHNNGLGMLIVKEIADMLHIGFRV